MRRIRIVLADLDENYLSAIETKIIEELGERADIVVITQREYLVEYFGHPQNLDVIIMDEGLYIPEVERQNCTNLFLLTETETEDAEEISQIQRVYKYTSVREIYNRTVNKLVVSNFSDEGRKAAAILTYSPIGGSGKTFFSMGLSAALAKSGKRVLFISTEPLQSFCYLLSDRAFSNCGFEKCLLSRCENILDYWKAATGHEGFDYLRPFKRATTALNIKPKNYCQLIEVVKDLKFYDFIIVDTSSEFSEEKAKLMGACDKTVILAQQDEISALKLAHLLENMDLRDEQKFMFVCNRFDSTKENSLVKNRHITGCTISESVREIDFSLKPFTLDTLSREVDFKRIAQLID